MTIIPALFPPPPHAVRRLVLDISPWGWVGLGVGVMAVLLMDLAWAVFPDRASVAILLSVCLPAGGLISAAKMPSWRLLPVTERQMGHGQWWRMVGGPLILLALCLAGGVVWAASTGMLHAAPSQVLSLFIRQAALAAIVPLALMCGGPVHAWLGRLGGSAMTVLLVAAAASAFPALSPAPFATLAVVALIAASAHTYARGLPVLPSWRMPTSVSGREGWSPRGWLGLATPLAAHGLGLCGAVAVLMLLDLLFPPHGPHRASNPGMAQILFASATIWCTSTFRGAGRVIGGLPAPPIALCLGLQGLLLGSELVIALLLLLDPVSNPSLAWLAWAMGVNACTCAWMLRARDQVEQALIYGGGLLAIIIASIDVQWPGKPDLSALLLASGLLLMAIGVYWSWLELSRGYRVWRAIPRKPVTWQGS